MTEAFTIRGYANVFCRDALVENGIRERVAPKAFTWLWRDIELHWGVHDGRSLARTGNRSMSLHQDDHGLAFEAALPWSGAGLAAYRAIADRTQAPFQASVYFTEVEADTFYAQDGVLRRYINSAKISHIAIVPQGAYSETRVWPALPAEKLPSDMRALAQQWELGRTQHTRQQRCSARRSPPMPQAAKPLIGRVTNGAPVTRSVSGLAGGLLSDATLQRYVGAGRLSNAAVARYAQKRQRLQQRARS